MPESATRRRVRVKAGDGKALCACRCPRPFQVGRVVAPGAGKSKIGGQDVLLAKTVAVPEA